MATISLTLPTAGTVITAGLHANNYTTIQNVINGNIDVNNVSASAGIKGSQLATGITGPAGAKLTHDEFTANVSCTATTEATANAIATASAFSFDGATPVMVEFYCNNFDAGDAPIFSLWLYDGAASIGRLYQRTVVTSTAMGGVRVGRRLTPSNASHTFSVRGSVSAGAGVSVKAGAGGLAADMPGFIRTTKE